jgi:hypothetical protein
MCQCANVREHWGEVVAAVGMCNTLEIDQLAVDWSDEHFKGRFSCFVDLNISGSASVLPLVSSIGLCE